MKPLVLKTGILWFLVLSVISAQSKIEGTVTDLETGKPVVNVNVYPLKTMLGSSTNKEGKFSINNIPPGIFYLVFSHVNYHAEKRKIKVTPLKQLNFNVKLKPKIYQLPAVTVEENKDEDWEENYELFKKQLLGTGFLAQQCEILNPYSVEFSKTEDGWLKAKCNTPLIIMNYGLGYKLKYFMDFFETNGYTTKFSGQPYFEEMQPANETDAQIYKENRLTAYCGSLTHFLRVLIEQYNYLNEQDSSLSLDDTLASLVANRLNSKLTDNGFTVLSCTDLPWKSIIKPIIYPADVSKIVAKTPDKNYYTLTFPHYLQITYNREWEEEGYLELLGFYNQPPGYQTSWIMLHKFSVLLDSKGHFFDEFAIETFGYWAYEKLGDMLPFEYEIEDSVLQTVNWTY